MLTKYQVFRVMGLVFLAAAAGLYGATLYVEDHMGMGFLMGLFTVTWFNAALLFTLSRGDSWGLSR